MLSDHNIEKLNLNGLYTCNPNKKYRGKIFEDNLLHCCNWTFRIKKNYGGIYFMVDTYWSSGDNVCIPLTDENIEEFKLLFEFDKVKSINQDEASHYERVHRVAVDSGGWSYPKLFVDIELEKSKDLIVKEIDRNIQGLENELKHLREKKKNIENGTYSLEWY